MDRNRDCGAAFGGLLFSEFGESAASLSYLDLVEGLFGGISFVPTGISPSIRKAAEKSGAWRAQSRKACSASSQQPRRYWARPRM
jgi:hypothetical protein